jgi:hypothetical protein
MKMRLKGRVASWDEETGTGTIMWRSRRIPVDATQICRALQDVGMKVSFTPANGDDGVIALDVRL